MPLWLVTPCANDVLWAYNLRHLELIESYMAATLRERRQAATYGWPNSSLVSRLPKWVGAAKNRVQVLKAIARLKARLGTCD
jgi:hypothetical protein